MNNFSNYSAWHHRSVIFSSYSHEQIVETSQNEFEFLTNAFFTDPNDQSAWIYYQWLLHISTKSFTEVGKIEEWKSILQEQFAMISELNDIQPNEKWVLFTLIEIHQLIHSLDSSIHLLDDSKVKEYLHTLKEIDSMRNGYYTEVEKDFSLLDI